MISNVEEYWKVKYLIEKRPPGTHQEFIFALASSSSVRGGRNSAANAREEQIKEWFKNNAGLGSGVLSFAAQRVGQRRRGEAVAKPVASTPRRTRLRGTAVAPQ